MKNKNEKYHTVRKVPNCNLKIIETEEKMIDAPPPPPPTLIADHFLRYSQALQKRQG